MASVTSHQLDDTTFKHRYEELRKDNGVREVNRRLGIVYPGATRRYTRILKRDSRRILNKREGSIHQYRQDNNPHGGKTKAAHSVIQGTKKEIQPVMSDLGVVRRTKYGVIEPTGFISDLPHLPWMRRYFGFKTYEWDLPYLTALQDLVWAGEWQLGHVPRFGGKTVTYLGIAPRELVEKKKPIMTLCSPKRVKVLFRGMINRVIRSPQLRIDYGDIIAVEDGRAQVDKTDRMMWINPEIPYPHEDPLYRVASRETDIIGSHPYHIHFEDISQSESEGETKRLIEWYEDVLLPMLSLYVDDDARLTATSTRKGPLDFDNYLMTKQSWTNRGTHYRAIEGAIPNVADVEFDDLGRVNSINEAVLSTLQIYNPDIDPVKLVDVALRNPISFASQYQNDPIPREGRYFTNEDIVEIDLPTIDYTGNQLFIEPAWGKTYAASETCQLVMTKHGRYIDILDASIGRYNKNVLETNAVELATGGDYKPTIAVHLENNFAQITSRFDDDSELLNLPGAKPFMSEGDKHERIQGLKGPLSMGRIRIHTLCRLRQKIINQILKYNGGKGSWDILDCISMGYLWLNRRRMKGEGKTQIGVYGSRFG